MYKQCVYKTMDIIYPYSFHISREQYILNGGLRVYSSRSFNAAGNLFQYVRTSAEESLFTSGPLQEPLTVQVSYTTDCSG